MPYGASAPRTALKFWGRIAGNANGFFVAWTEFTDQYRVIGAFLSRDAQPIGSPMVVAAGALIDVESAGDRYVVATGTPTGTPTKTWEVTPSGAREVPPRIEEKVLNARGEHLVQTWEGGVFTVWIYGSDGALHDPPRQAKEIPVGSRVVHTAAKGDDWVLVTEYFGLVQWLRVGHEGIESAVVVPGPVWVNGRQSRVYSRPAMNGSTMSLAWDQIRKNVIAPGEEYQRTLGYTVIDMQTGASSERVVDSTALPIGFGQAMPRLFGGSAMFNGTEFVYAWTWFDSSGASEVRVAYGQQSTRVLFRRANAFGLDMQPVLASEGGRDLLFLWAIAPHGRTDILARVLTPSSSADDGTAPALISTGPPAQAAPFAVATAHTTLTTWVEGEPSAVLGRFVFPSGPGALFKIIDGGDNVAMAASPDTFLLAWQVKSGGEYRVMLRRYDENGVPVDAQPLSIITPTVPYPFLPNIFFDGTNFVVYWREFSLEVINYVWKAIRVPNRGAISGAPVKIAGPEIISLVQLDGRLVKVWTEYIDQFGYVLRGARLRNDLQPETAIDMWLLRKPENVAFGDFTIRSNGKELMIVLVARLGNETSVCPRTRRFGLNLWPAADEVMLDCSAAAAGRPIVRLQWDGEQYWLLMTSGSQANGNEQFPFTLWRLDANGKAYDPHGVSIRDPQGLSMERSPLGLMLTYARPDDNGVFRGFQTPILFQLQKGRATRH